MREQSTTVSSIRGRRTLAWLRTVSYRALATTFALSGLVAAAPASRAAALNRPFPAGGHSSVHNNDVPTPTPTGNRPPGSICWSSTTSDANKLTSCDHADSPHNETTVAVNPLNPLNMIASANDYDFEHGVLQPKAHVTLDGGKTWGNYPIGISCSFGGDPTIAFDAVGTAYLSILCSNDGSVYVTSSTNGGGKWAPATQVAAGTPTLFNDHPTVAAWGIGNVVVTWIAENFVAGPDDTDQITSVPMAAAVSHDGAKTFSRPANASGSAPQCIGLTQAHACDQTSGNSVTVARDGSIYAAFMNGKMRGDGGTTIGRNAHFVVKLDANTGGVVGSPHFQGIAYDGLETNDFPTNNFPEFRQTLQDSQLRIAMQGNIVADPTNAKHLAVTWFDDRNAPRLPVDPNPYLAKTNADIIVTQSYDGGSTWSAPQAIRRAGDQFFPWAAYSRTGHLQIGYFDRSYDPANHKYGYTLASETTPGSLQFTQAQLTTMLSDPTRDDVFAIIPEVDDPNFPHATHFLGDYSGIATVGDSVVAVWTDMRQQTCDQDICGHGQDTYAAVVSRR